MKYMGGKHTLAPKLLNLILPYRNGRPWAEPFVGGANVLWRVPGKRFANDTHRQLIAMYQALVTGWDPPRVLSKQDYLIFKDNQANFPDCLVGFIGFGGSYGGKWWGGYAQGAGRNFLDESAKALLKIRNTLKNVVFSVGSYEHMVIPPNSLIYCDPPYANTTGYSASDFNSDHFWEWCRIMAHSGHLVFVSEYSAPCDIEVVAEFEKTSSLIQNSTKYSRECLFRVSHRKITYFDQIRG